MLEHTFDARLRFTVTEHDPDRPWVVVGQEHRTITLGDDVNFFEFAHEQWPAPLWSVELDPALPEWRRD